MNLFQKLAWGIATRAAKLAGRPPRDPALAAYFSHPTAAGVDINEDTALNYSAVWAAVNVYASNVATMPIEVQKIKADGSAEVDRNHPLTELVQFSPNPEMTWIGFSEALQGHALTFGNAYAEIEMTNGGTPAALWPLDPARTTPVRVKHEGKTQDLYEIKLPTGEPEVPVSGHCSARARHRLRRSQGLWLCP